VSLAGVALNAPFPAVCDEWPYRDLGDGFRGPLVSDVPVLFVSGTLDGHTPVSNVSELLPGFPNALHLIVENATHQYLEFAHPGVVPAMAGYMEGVAPETLVLTAPSPFAPKEESASVTK
jgi:pimeloyl-ACP methyl ester carboxylesterase